LLAKFASAQYTAIPDPNFEQWLLDAGIDSEGTLDGQILTSDALNVVSIEIINPDNNIASFEGIEDFDNLESFVAGFTNCATIDFGSLPILNNILLQLNEDLDNIDISECPALEIVGVSANNLSSINVDNNPLLRSLSCGLNNIVSINLRFNPALTIITCQSNQLENLDLRNGANTLITGYNSSNNPSLDCIFVDDPVYSEANWTNVDATSNFVSNEAECKALSISDFQKFDFVIYPNPVSTFFEFDNRNGLEIERLELFDLGGKLVKKFNVQMSAYSVYGLKKGIYFLKIKHEDSISIQKLVIE
jgi:hypothetical protein